MKKRILAMILCLTMLLGMIPMSVVAEGEESDAHVHTSHEGWTAVAGTGKLPTTTGKYYLTEDNMLLTAVAEIASAQEIVLCLNGKTVDCTQAKRAFRLCKGANVTICDCTAKTEDGAYTAGSIKNATNTAILIGTETPSATLKIYDGIFQDNKISSAGSVVIAQGGSQVEIHDGAFIHNSAGTNAGAIYANNATVKVHGGIFSNNSAGTSGGAFYISNANLELHGGTIRENTAAHGGALFVQNNSNILLNGVTITENTATARGGGIDYTGNGTLKIGGTTKVTGNSIDKDTDNANNLVLVNGRKLQLDAENAPLQTGAEIGVSVCAWGSDAVPDYSMGSATVFASNATQENVAQYFKVDRPGTDHYIQQKNGNLRFALPKAEHPVEHYHTEENWTEWTQTGSLPVETGNYYLAGDVDVTASAGVQVSTAQNIVLCLNGYTVTGKDRIYRLSKGANVTICDCTSYYNEDGEFVAGKLVPGTAEGGAIGLFADGEENTVTTLTLKNILIDGTGKQNSNGGALQLSAAGATVFIEDCVIRDCTTTGRGGAIRNYNGVLQVTDSLITNNNAKYGGALFVEKASQTTLTNVTITDNTASTYSGGIHNELTVSGTGFLKLEGDTIIQDNINTKTNQTSNVNLVNQARRVLIGQLGEDAQIGVIAEATSNSQDLGAVTVCEQTTEVALNHIVSDMGHEVYMDGTALKIRPRVHTTHATDECGHENVTWTATKMLPTAGGHYYLTSNVKVTSVAGAAYNTGAEVTICLNGYSIIGAEGCRIFRMSNGTVLNICDCTGHGTITGGSNTNGGVAWISKDSADATGGTLNLYGGIITGNTSADDKALFVVGNGNLTVAGGQIRDNQARIVLLQSGSFTMSGGKICNNEYSAGDGVVLRMSGGSFTMSGGEISGNANKKFSGTIRIDNGTALLSGGKICGNTMVNAGGILLNGGKTTLAGVEISNNIAKSNGGGVYIMGASEVILNGAVITGNTATKAGGGIYNSGTGTLKIGGNTQIINNTVAGAANNLDLVNVETFQIDTLIEGAAIGITGKLENMSADGKLAIGTDAVQADAAAYFTSDQAMNVEQQEGIVYLTLPADLQHAAHASDECGHASVTWKFWADDASLPLTEGHYYLTKDVTLGALGGALYGTGDEVTICLNGFTISGADTGRAFRLSNGTVLNICDCSGKGLITNCNNNKAGVAWIGKDATDADPGTLNLYGGKITGCVTGTNSALFHLEGGNLTVAGGQISDNKSRIVMMPSGSFTMSGGKICNNEYSAGDGVVLRMTGGSFTMTGGEISGNENTAFGGTIRIDNGTAQLNGGKICGNKAKSSAGVLVTGGTVNLEGVEISYNETPGAGAGLYIMNEATVTVGSGTKIMHNTAKGTGGAGIHFIGKSAVTLDGAIITDNVAAQAGGGVYHNGTGTLTISGSTKITGNTAAGRANNLQLANGVTFRVGTLAEGAQIGVVADLKSMSDEGKLVIGTDAIQTDAAAYFTSDQNMGVEQKDGTVYLTLRADALHTPHASDACGHDNVTWKFWADDASLPLTEGHYYLTQDVTLGALGGAIFNTGAEVTICLNGFTISGAGTGRAFRLSNGSVLNVCDCTGKGLITNCNNNKAGVAWIGKDAADTEPGTLNLYGGKITGCHAGMDSALFHLEGGNFTMHDGLITENDSRILFVSSGAAEIHGGKITNNIYSLRDGSVLRMPDGTFTMTGGEISGNVNEAYSGALRVDKGTATITGGKISGNKAMNGAAIIMAGGKLSVTDTEICDNVATSSGGAIYLFGEVEAYLGKGTVISGNSAGNNAGAIYTEKAKITMEDVTVTGNTAAKTGGGIYFTHAEATMTRVSVTKNTAETGAGVVSGRTNQLTIKDSSIANNTATNAGGGLLIQSAADVTLINSKISGNSAKNNGGGVYVSYDGHLNNKSGTIENNSANGFGGGVYLADEMTMSGGSISGNYAKKEGGGVYITEGSHKDADGKTVYNAAVFNMYGGSISYNSTDVNGAGLCVRGQKGLFNLYGGTISNNTATNTKSGTGHAGGVLAQGKGTFYMYGGTICDNKATTAGGGIRVAPNSAFGIYGGTISGNTAWRGGGVYAEEDFVFEKCTVTDNTADNEGGGLYVSGCKMTMNSGTISNNRIADKNEDGVPDGSSGGMTVRASAECIMNGGQIIGNIGKHAGGVVVQSGGIFTMNDGLFAENRAEGGSGGGLYNSRSTAYLLGGTFKDNVATVGGGAVFTDGLLTVDNCEFIGNTVTAASGGSGSGGAIKVGQKTHGEIKNSTFTDNYVMGSAGALDISYKGSAVVSGCTFTNNTASVNGGALRMYTVGTLDMDDCVFKGNTSMGSGGAMCVESTSVVHVQNTSFESNKGTSGGAVYIGAITRADFANCTFTGNTANRFGSAIYANGGVYLTDTTITDQQGKAHAVSLTAEGSDGESFMTGTNQFKGNVIIADNAGGGLELLEGAFVNIHGDGLGEQAKILVTQPQGAITENIFGAYNYVREGDVYTLTKGNLALRQADPATVEEEIVPETTEPETPSETPNSAKRTVLIIFGVLLAGSAVLTVVAVLSVKKMKKRNSVEQTK